MLSRSSLIEKLTLTILVLLCLAALSVARLVPGFWRDNGLVYMDF